MKALLLIMLGGVLVNNYALEKFLGVGPVLGGRKYGSAAMGFSVAAVMLLAAAVTWPLYRLLVLLGAEYLETLIFVLVVQQIEGNIIAPKVQGDAAGIHPITVMFALLACNRIWGTLGMLVSTPVAAIVKLIIREMYDYVISPDLPAVQAAAEAGDAPPESGGQEM